MTVSELFLTVTQMLEKAGCDSPAFDACCLLEDLAQVPHGRLLSADQTALGDDVCDRVLSAATRRVNGEPLQYLLGRWDFLTLTLQVGEGVLIPRPDTELLCEVAAEKLSTLSHPTVLDLCAGSGCVGLGICSLYKEASVTAVELSDDALRFLRNNAAAYPGFALTVVKDDVCLPRETYAKVDAIVSNPPYIPTGDLDGLMTEVQFEPRMALDGDEDGLRFYRAIVTHWLPLLKDGGLLAVEVGIGQATDVKTLFEEHGLGDVEIRKDLGGIDRVVCGIATEKCEKT